MNDDYRVLRLLDDTGRRGWLRERFPSGANNQWWSSILELAEWDSRRLPFLSEVRRREHLEFALSLLDFAIEEGLHPVFAVQ